MQTPNLPAHFRPSTDGQDAAVAVRFADIRCKRNAYVLGLRYGLLSLEVRGARECGLLFG